MSGSSEKMAAVAAQAKADATVRLSRKQEAILPVQLSPQRAIVLLKPPYRDAAYVRRHVEYVVAMGAERGERHVRANLECIRENLEALGIAQRDIDLEVRRIEGAVRAEIWRQVLIPDDGAS